MKRSALSRLVCIILISFVFHEYTVAQWQKTSGPPGMDIRAFFQRSGNLFAGTSSNGVFKSTDNGVNWVASNTGLSDRAVFTFTASGMYIYAGTDNGVFRSKNNGLTWQAANNGIQQKFIYSFVFANGFLFAGTSGGLYKSSDKGVTWTDANGNALTSSTIHDVIFTPPHLVVIADNLVFYSDDNGDSWNYNPGSPFILGANPSFLAQRDSVLMASGAFVFRSFDGGINWGNAIQVTPGDEGNIIGLVKSGNNIFAGTKEGMFPSSNFGRTWKFIQPNNIRKGKWFAHDFYKSGNNFLLAYDEIGTGYSADSGKNWSYSLQGFPPAASIDNAMIFSNNILYTGTHGDGVYKSSDTGNTFKKIGTANNRDTLSNSNIYALLKIKNIILAGTCGNGLYCSVNNGSTWKHITKGLPTDQGYLCVQSLAKTNKAVLIATDQGLFYSLDSGLTWKSSDLVGKNVMAVAANDSFACAAVENVTGPSTIYRSVNNPASWNIVFQSFDADWTCMASDGRNHFYAGTLVTTNFVSNNNGLNWQTVGSGIPANSGGYAIGVRGSNVFIGNSDGVYFSNNNGVSFTKANTGFNNTHAVQGFSFSSTHVYAGLFQNSIWKRPLSDFGITSLQQPQENKLPVTFFPNPLSRESKLTYTIASKERVIINLYNNNGNLIRNIKNGVEDTGNYSVIISKENLQPGSYFLSVLAGNKHATININVVGN